MSGKRPALWGNLGHVSRKASHSGERSAPRAGTRFSWRIQASAARTFDKWLARVFWVTPSRVAFSRLAGMRTAVQRAGTKASEPPQRTGPMAFHVGRQIRILRDQRDGVLEGRLLQFDFGCGRGGIWQGYWAEIVHWAALLKHGV